MTRAKSPAPLPGVCFRFLIVCRLDHTIRGTNDRIVALDWSEDDNYDVLDLASARWFSDNTQLQSCPDYPLSPET